MSVGRRGDSVGALGSATGLRALAGASFLIGVLAALLGLVGSWIPSLWGDEAASVLSATRPLSSLFMMVQHVDAVHGTYYLGLHAWIDAFGSSPVSVRMPSALALGVGAAAVTWMCGRARGIRFGVLAGVIVAVLPRLTYDGEEARSYEISAALAAVLCALVVEISRRRRPSRWWWVGYAVVLEIGTWAFLYFGLMALAVGVTLTLVPALRHQWRRWLVASAAAFVAALPLIVAAVSQIRQIAYLQTQTPVTPDSVFVQMWFGSVWFAVVAWVLIVVAAVGTVRDIRARRVTGEDAPVLEILVLSWLVVPMGLLIGMSPVLADYTARYGTYAAPAAAILIASGVVRVARGAARRRAALGAAAGGALLVLVIGLAVPVWAAQRTPYAKNGSDWNDIARVIHAHAAPGDAIVFDDGARPSRRPRLAMNTDPVMFRGLKDVTLKSPYRRNPTWHDTVYTVAQAAARGRFDGIRTVWMVEYVVPGTETNGDAPGADSWGLKDLRALGYHETARIEGHSSLILRYDRRQ